LSIRGVVSILLLFHGGIVLGHVGGHASAPAKPHDSGVFDHGGVGYLSCAQGYFTSYSGGGIHRGVHGSLRTRIQCAIPSILEGGADMPVLKSTLVQIRRSRVYRRLSHPPSHLGVRCSSGDLRSKLVLKKRKNKACMCVPGSL
jgi:hypothetical protein